MKSWTLAVSLLALLGCKQPAQDAEVPKVNPKSMLQLAGCSVSKSQGVISVICTDGSSAVAGSPSQFIRDANGVDLSEMLFIGTIGSSSTMMLNRTSGHVLGYTAGALWSVNKTFYETANCTGTAYASTTITGVKNLTLSNSQAWPGAVDALKVVSFAPSAVILSKFEGNACSALSTTITNSPIVEPTSFDASDPLSIALPLEIVVE